jgi:hypothetical protein
MALPCAAQVSLVMLVFAGCSSQDGVRNYPDAWPRPATLVPKNCSSITGTYLDKGIYDPREYAVTRPDWFISLYGYFFKNAGVLSADQEKAIATAADSVRIELTPQNSMQITALKQERTVASTTISADKIDCSGGSVTLRGKLKWSGGEFVLAGAERDTTTLFKASNGSLVIHGVFSRTTVLLIFPYRERTDEWYRFEPINR